MAEIGARRDCLGARVHNMWGWSALELSWVGALPGREFLFFGSIMLITASSLYMSLPSKS